MHGDIIKKIQKEKGVGSRLLSKRTGIASGHLTKKEIERAGLKTLIRICDGLGVELCIIDGWKKYTLNSFRMRELDMIMKEMSEVGEGEDRWKKRKLDHEAWEKMGKQRYCRGCEYCMPELEKDGVYWCRLYEEYMIRKECKDRVEKDIPKVFRE